MNPFTIIGETSQILIRTWTEEDLNAWYTLSQDSGLNQFTLSGYKMANQEAAMEFIKRSQETFHSTKIGQFPIFHKESMSLIGICGLKSTQLDDEATERIEIMYRLARDYWGKGYATDSGKLVLKYGFESLKLNQIIGFIVPENIRSRSVLLKLGMSFVRNSSLRGHKVEVYSKNATLQFEDFQKIDLRSGTIVRVEPFPKARKLAYKVWVDFGPIIGIKQTSAQITVHYTPESLLGKSVIGCTNLGTKNIGGFVSEFLIVGFSDETSAIRLATIDGQVPNGEKLH